MARKWFLFFCSIFPVLNRATIKRHNIILLLFSLSGSMLRRLSYGLLAITIVVTHILGGAVFAQASTPAALIQQGKVAYEQGSFPTALAIWQQAEVAYRQAQEPLGVAGSQLNQAQALVAMGRYRRACQTLTGLVDISEDVCTAAVPKRFGILTTQLPPSVQVSALNNLGEVLRLVGNLAAAQVTLSQAWSLATPISVATQAAVALSIANNLRDLGNRDRDRTEQLQSPSISLVTCPTQPLTNLKAAAYYQRSIACYQAANSLPAQLNQLGLQVEISQWLRQHKQGQVASSWQQQFNQSALIQNIQRQLSTQPHNYDGVTKRINFARSLVLVANPLWPAAQKLLTEAIEQARTFDNKIALTNAVGTMGWLSAQAHEWPAAIRLTEEAIDLANTYGASDTLYRWEWQLGKILQEKNEPNLVRSQAAYQRAVVALEKTRGNIRVINPDAQFALRDQIEPLYRELVDLSLRLPQPDLAQVIAQVDALKLVELENFLQCQLTVSQSINEFAEDAGAAVFYPVILDDRLEVILQLPGNQLQRFVVPVTRTRLATTLQSLRKNLTQPQFGWDVKPAAQLYDWLLRPAQQYLNPQIKNLVFVMDGVLQDLPVAALFDRQRQEYLIDRYPVSVTPGLKILGAKKLGRDRSSQLPAELSNILIGALTTTERQTVGGKRSVTYEPLPYAAAEVQGIKSLFPRSTELVGSNFTRDNLRRALASNAYPIVHLATHGVFSSDVRQTFIVTAGDQSIDLPDLQKILKQGREGTIDLMVLSACETAAGDRRSALGLAGMALRSGAASTLASLWSVDDLATAKLMQKFYGSLIKTGVSKAEALRVAQRGVRSEHEHPYYWASFVLVGNWL
jgi:CHAT domain-containing protein